MMTMTAITICRQCASDFADAFLCVVSCTASDALSFAQSKMSSELTSNKETLVSYTGNSSQPFMFSWRGQARRYSSCSRTASCTIWRPTTFT